MDENGKFQRDITDLPSLDQYSYENIFKVFQHDNYYYYNILKKISLDGILRPGTFYRQRINRRLPYTGISYMAYNTIHLWWLICTVNNIQNPVHLPNPGGSLKIIHPTLVNKVIDNIKSQLVK
jgi:hypothetical protein